MHFDTIVAPITGLPPAAVAWIRLSGAQAWEIASAIFSPWPEQVAPGKAVYGRLISGDDGFALPFAAHASYTGEPTVELSMHGSRASILSAVEACVREGARMAEPGEFTQRAFLNGRIDLTQAEAVRETIDALTDAQLKQANRNREGALRQEVEALRAEAIRMLAAVEASVDFSEEIGDFDRSAATRTATSMLVRIAQLRKGAKVSRIVRDGYRIAIVGPPNAGKSSLLNRLLGADRAIVTDIPGTTRDFVEERADFDGVPVVLVDTAGLRETADLVEKIGIERTRSRAAEADEIWFLYDGTRGLTTEDREEIAQLGPSVRLLANKCDLGETKGEGIRISVNEGHGIDALVESVREKVLHHVPAVAINERQANHLQECEDILANLSEFLASDVPDDLLSVFLNDLIATLGRITGQTAEESMIERIFHDFCVGK